MKRIKILLLSLLIVSCYNDTTIDSNTTQKEEPQTFKVWVDDDFEASSQRVVMLAVEATINPTTVTGGTLDEVTITGSGFGIEKNRISWGGAQTAGWQISFWSDTEIRAIVPSHARTGEVRILTAGGTEIGAGNLTVRYSIYNTTGQVEDSYQWYRFSHVDNSGVVFHVPEGTPQSFRDDFRRALAEWTCRIGINWSLSNEDVPAGTNYTNQPDGVSIAYLGWSPGCASAGVTVAKCEGINEFYVRDITIMFDGCKDYKTMLHELGHAAQLGHNYNGGSIMSPTGGKEIGSIDEEAGREVMRWNLIDNVECQTIITEDGCVTVNTYYADTDGDGFGDPNNSVQDESQPNGYVTNNNDCDDTDPLINPNATEILDNNIDEDCDGEAQQTPVTNYNKELKVRLNKRGLTTTITGDFFVTHVNISDGSTIQLPRKKKFTIPFNYPNGTYILTYFTESGIEIVKKVKKR